MVREKAPPSGVFLHAPLPLGTIQTVLTPSHLCNTQSNVFLGMHGHSFPHTMHQLSCRTTARNTKHPKTHYSGSH